MTRLDFTPYAHQREAHALRESNRFTVLVWHRRAGKTVFAVMELILAALACPRAAGRFAYLAPYLKQGKAVAWDYLRGLTRALPGCVYNESELSVTLANGARIRIYGGDNPDALRGIYLDGVVLDEVADMRPEVWGQIIRPALADRMGWALFIGTPKGVNLFSELYDLARKGEPDWAHDVRTAKDTTVIPAAELEAARRSMGPNEYAQEFLCDFGAASDDVLISHADVLRAQELVLGEAEYVFAPKVIGVDVARYGNDRTVFFPRQGRAAFAPSVFEKQDTMATADKLAVVIDKWAPDRVFIDVAGPGGGVVDRLRQLGHRVTPVDFGSRPLDVRFRNRRVEMWWHMADWVRTGGALPESSDLRRDLTGPTYSHDRADGRLDLESKDDLRKRGVRSPDLADALALTFAAPVRIQTPKDRHTALQKRQEPRDYDPYAREVTA